MGMMDMPPAFSWSHLDRIAFSWWTTILILLAGAIYLLGVARYERATGAAWSRKRTVSFLGALVLILVATESVVALYDMTLFTAHMIQHLMLIMVAAGLIAMAAPLELALATVPGAPGRWLNEAAGSKVGEILGHPITGLLLYAIFIPATHLTSLFNLMLTHMWVHHLEQFGFLVVGYLFWRPVVAIEPTRHPLQPGARHVRPRDVPCVHDPATNVGRFADRRSSRRRRDHVDRRRLPDAVGHDPCRDSMDAR